MRPLTIWTAYFACLAVVLGSLSWFATRVVGLQRGEWKAIADEHEAESARLALWRMEYAIGPLLTTEASRAYYQYAAYHIGERPATESLIRSGLTEQFVASEVLAGDRGFVRLHFQISGDERDERVTSPQVPDGALEALAIERDDASKEEIAAARQGLGFLEEAFKRHPLKRLLINLEREEQVAGDPGGLVADQPSLLTRIKDMRDAQAKDMREAQARLMANTEAQNVQRSPVRPGSPVVTSGPMRALWCGDCLILARHVVVNGEPWVQGCWLDRPKIEARLLEDVKNLLPAASLRSRAAGASLDAADQGLALVGLPFQLDPGAVPPRRGESGSSAYTALYLALSSALVAALAVGVVLRVLLAAAERRAAFVSAVTHELRTPLTTLRMSAEMLASGRVKPERQRGYFDTLLVEAERLAALVENVLAYSRIEAHRALPKSEPIALSDLLHRVTDRARERAERAGMALDAAVDDGEQRVLADAAAVEQIVFNLVDNACKYAGDSGDKRIELRASATPDGGRITVHDHGPGIDAAAARRLFQPFSRPDNAETSSKPGVGLGLALCRRLARSMGGELRFIAAAAAGACFELELARG